MIPNNTMANTFVPGVSLLLAPSTIEALETDYKTPSSYNWSIGLAPRAGLGHVDGRDLRRQRRPQPGDVLRPQRRARRGEVPRSNPANRDPGSTNPTAVLPDDFLRPYSATGAIRVRGNSGTSDYHALQVQVNRRYIHGVQFGGAYTLQRARGLADEDPGNLSITLNRPRDYLLLASWRRATGTRW